MKRQNLICLTFLALFLFSSIFVTGPTVGLMPDNLKAPSATPLAHLITSSSSPPLPKGPTWDGDEYLYEDLSAALDTNEYAYGKNASSIQDLQYGTPQYGEITHPAGWTDYELAATITNLMDNNTWIDADTRNGDFEDSWTDWSYTSNGLGPQGSDPYHGRNWGTSYGRDSTNGVRVWINYTTPALHTTDYAAFQQTFTLARQPTWARLHFDVLVEHYWYQYYDRDELAIYVEIGGEVYLLTVDYYCPDNDVWYDITLPIPYNDIQNWGAPGSISVTLGLGFIIDFNGSNQGWALWFDNVEFEVQGKAQPAHSTIGLQMNGTSVVNGASYGTGSVSLTGTFTTPGNTYQMFAEWETTNSESKQVEFNYELRLYVQRTDTTQTNPLITAPSGVNYWVANDSSNGYWTTWYYVSNPIPGVYFQYNLSLTKPSGNPWMIEKITNPLGDDRTSVVTETSTHYLLTPSAIGVTYGWWNFTFTSPNRVNPLSGITTSYQIGDSLTVTANYGLSSGQTNLTLYYPNRTIVDEESDTFTGGSNTFTTINFNDGTKYLAGTYTLCITYDNDQTGPPNTQTEIGFRSKEFTIIHHTELTPEQSPLPVDYGPMGSFKPRVYYNDTDRDWFIQGATITGLVSGHPVTFYQAGSWYEAEISNNLLTPGDYVLSVDATALYYQPDSTTIDLEVRSATTLTSPESPGLTLPYDDSFTIQVFYADSVGQGIAGATITTPGWTGPPISGNGTDGWYDITRDTSLKPSPGTYPLTIQAVDPAAYHESQTLVLSIIVRKISTTLDYTPPGSVPWGNDVEILLDFTANDPESTTHDGDLITSANFALQLDGTPLSLTTDYTLVNHTDGTYTITLLATSGKISTIESYSLRVQATPSNTIYGGTSRTINFLIVGHQTQTIVIQPDPTPYGDTTDGISVQWSDLNGTSLNPYPSFFDYLEVRNATDMSLIATRTSLIFNLDTSTWLPGTYDLTVTTFPDTSLYFGSTGSLRIIITIHQTAVTILPPEPTPWGETTNVTIQWVDLTAGGYISISKVSQIVITGAISDTINNPSSWTITLDTTGLTIGGSPYSITIEVRARTTPTRIYADSSSAFNELTIRAHRVYVLVTGPPPVPEDGSISINVDWTDLDTGNPILPSFLDQVEVTQISGPSAPGLPDYFTSLDFIIDATGWARGIHRLNITVYSNDVRFQTGFGPVNVVIRIHSINADVDPIPRVPYGNDILIILRVNDSDLVPPAGLPENHIASIVITGGPSTITLDSSNWFLWVNNGTVDDGIYEITLDVSSWGLGTYGLQFNVYTSAEYGDGSVTTQLTIRALATSFTYQSPPVVAWGEDGKLIVTYLVDDPTADQDNNPITGAAISIAGLTQGLEFTFIYWQNGKYNITFYSSYLTSVQIYQFDITIIRGSQYENGQLDAVPLSVRALFTWLHPTDVPITPFGDNVIIDVEYIVLDGESSINGDPIHTGTETIIVTGLDGFNPVSVSWQWVGALSVYRITIDASDITQIQAYKIMISISGSGSGYQPDTIPELTFNVRTVFTAMAVEPVDAQAYLDNFTIRITYTVNDPDSSINGQGIDGQASIIRLIEYPGLFTVLPQGNGIYDIIINSTSVGAPSSYLATIDTNWAQSPPPYAIQTKQVTLFVTERPTDIRNTVTGEYGYLDEITVNFTYSDQLRSEWITNTSYGGGHVLILVYNTTPAIPVLISSDAWWVIPIAGVDAFQLQIDADYFGRVNIYFDFKVEVTWQTGAVPYFEIQEFEFRAYVVGQRTDIIIQPSTGPTPYGSNMIILFRYVTEGGKGINETQYPLIDVSLLCEQIPTFGVQTLDWDYTFHGDGYYEIWIDTTRLLGIGSYTFFMNITYPGGEIPFFQSQYNEPAPRRVRYIDTVLEYEDPGFLYAGDDLNITVRYYDLDNSQHVPNIPAIDFVITGGTVQSGPTLLVSGWWEFIIDTSALPAGGEFTLWIFANQSYYYWQNISAPVYIYRVPLSIALTTSGVIERYYGEQPEANITVTITIGAGSLAGNYVTDAVLEGYWDNPRLIAWHNYGNGTYTIALSSTYPVERYPIEIRASKLVGPYANASIFITYTITAGPSQLIPPFGTSQIVYIGNDYNVTVIYQTPFGDPLRSVEGAVVTYSSLDLGVDNIPMVEIAPGIYQWNFSSSGYLRGIITISVKATFPNVQSGTQFFTIDARETPAEIQVENPVIGVYYDELFSVNVTLMQTLDNIPLPGETIEALWQGYIYTLTHIGGGNYTFTFLANLTAGRTYDLPLDLITTSYDCNTLTLQISITDRPMQGIELVDAWTYYPGAENTTVSLFDPEAPLGDMFYLLFSYVDYEGYSVPGGGGTATVGTTPIALAYHSGYSGYLLAFNTSQFGIETFNVFVTIGRDNYETQVDQFSITLRRINMELHLIEMFGNVTNTIAYVNQPLELLVFLEDTDHGWGVTNANWSLPQNWEVEPDLGMGPGYYRIYGIESRPTILFVDISVFKDRPFEHATASLQMTLSVEFNPTVQLLINVGTVSAIVLIIILIGWILWARVYSIPWEVRRIRKLAKSVDKEEGYKLSKKDLKRFHERGVVLEDKVDSAMSTIGVAATPAMIPAVEEVEEVTATEEDIMGELDKIPGLGPEERAVLAEEMRKIPRKDRIWFLDDLRRQMGQRRMDFLTTREKPPVEPTPKAVKKPKVKPEEKPAVPLEKVKPEEPPPPDKVLTEDRTAPTVLPPEVREVPVPKGVEAEIRRELDKIPGLSADEKQALVDHLKHLSKEERQATYLSLRQTADE